MSREPRDPKNQQGKSIACVTQGNRDGKVIPLSVESQPETYLRNWLAKLPEDPTEAVCSAKILVGSSRAQFDNAKLYAAVAAYRAAQKLKMSDSLWQAFVRHPTWTEFAGHKPKIESAGEHLRWVMIFVFDAKDERGKERSNVYRGALQTKFDAGAPAESLIAFVKEAGGIDAAYRQPPRILKTQGSDRVSDDDETSDDSDQSDGSDDDGGSDNSDNSGSNEKEGKSVAGIREKEDPETKERHRSQGQLSAKIKAVNKNGFVPWIVGISPQDIGGKIQRYARGGKILLECEVTLEADGWFETTCISVRRGKF